MLRAIRFIVNVETHYHPKRSGGIGVYIKDDILGSTTVLHNTCEYIIWLTIKHDILNLDSDILLGAIYLPPTGSRYLDEDQMILLDEEIAQYCTNYTFSILLGDVNARTACLPDYIVSDDFLSSHFDFDTETTNYFSKHVTLENLGYPLQRQSKDKKTNPHGYS